MVTRYHRYLHIVTLICPGAWNPSTTTTPTPIPPFGNMSYQRLKIQDNDFNDITLANYITIAIIMLSDISKTCNPEHLDL